MKSVYAFTLASVCAFLSLAPYAQAQTNASASAGKTTAFFYQKPEVLDRDKHQNLRIKAGNTQFASRNQFVPLVVTEFAEACLEYPIVFTQGNDGQWLALALTGLKQDHNAFVDAQGQWQARFVPASVRRYPFILAESGNNTLSLAIDMAAAQVTASGGKDGEAVFDAKGQPTEFINKLLPVLSEYQGQAGQSSAFLKKLESAGLLTLTKLQVSNADGRSAEVDGLWIVDETKFRALADEQVLAWFKSGELALVHAHMLSLRNMASLLERSLPARPPQATAPATTAAKNKK